MRPECHDGLAAGRGPKAGERVGQEETVRHSNFIHAFVTRVPPAARIRRRAAVAAFVAALVSLAVATPSRGADGTPPPLIGATYTHTSLSGCSLELTGLVLGYDTPGV